jgi:hypothetical protein
MEFLPQPKPEHRGTTGRHLRHRGGASLRLMVIDAKGPPLSSRFCMANRPRNEHTSLVAGRVRCALMGTAESSARRCDHESEG